MNLDLITYGNPTQNQVQSLTKESYLDNLFDDLRNYTFPKNSSEATKQELNQIVDALNDMQDPENQSAYLNRYRAYDGNIKAYLKSGLIKSGIDEQEVVDLVENISEDITPLLLKLKFYHQRPRPYQLAEYYKLKLFPFGSHSSHSPSFPSGHSFQAKIITEVVGNHYPKMYSFLQDLFEDISYSRMYLGLHYQSDLDVGIFCAEKVLKNAEFMKRYKL
jgi:hypothetical protein